jgi:transcription-repair coupling factor (superfamily II helicase)
MRAAHGQMSPRELENVMMAFLERQFEILVATKIIESGLDIPNVNTIVINRADRFGMAELYQLRGRVGRSNIQAYAYLLIPPASVMPRQTIQRLQAVEEFTELGSGFNLAMRDLEIRGAGNLLGAEQSGFIENMGFETYTRILEEAVGELKDEEFKELFASEQGMRRDKRESVVETDLDAFIPESYIGGDADRLAMYRQLYLLTTPEQLKEVQEEMEDRFGKMPRETANLLEVVRLRLRSSGIGFPKVSVQESGLEVEFPPAADAEFFESERFQHMMARIAERKSSGLVLHQDGTTLRLRVPIPRGVTQEERLAQAIRLLEELTGKDEAAASMPSHSC